MKNSSFSSVNSSQSINNNHKYSLDSISAHVSAKTPDLTDSTRCQIDVDNGTVPNGGSTEKQTPPTDLTKVPENHDTSESQCQLSVCNVRSYNHLKFHQLLSSQTCDMKTLAELSWNGIPWCSRAKVWRMLSGYLPSKLESQQDALNRKRQEYQNFVDQYFCYRTNSSNNEYYRQIIIDIPRTHPNLALLQNQEIIDLYERVLLIWAVRHPACGYVQGINDLIAPFLIVYLHEYLGDDYDVENISNLVTNEELSHVESDVYWTFSHLLDSIQDNYTPDQPGIQKRVRLLEKIISFADKRLYQFLTDIKIQFLQFSLRWMNNLLVREIPIECTIRLWDTYFSESQSFDRLHLFVCAAFLIKFSSVIVRLQDFQEVSYFIQNLPTHTWTEEDISVLLAEAFQLQFLYSNILERD